jgi:hypothetical protein
MPLAVNTMKLLVDFDGIFHVSPFKSRFLDDITFLVGTFFQWKEHNTFCETKRGFISLEPLH